MAGPVGIDNRRHLAVWVYRAEFRGVLLALAGIDRHGLIGQAGLLQKQSDLRRVWGRVIVEADHAEPFLRLTSTRFPARSGTAEAASVGGSRASALKCTMRALLAIA